MMNVPVEGVAVGADTYVFFATKYDFPTNTYGGSAIVKTTGLAFDQLTVLAEDAPGDFSNVSVVVEHDEAFIFGTSAKYRESAETMVQWNLEDLRGEKISVVIEDTLTGALGFVGARDFVLR